MPELIAALQSAVRRDECDVLIMGRGGGSLEDLWAFNDEQLARAIAESSIPVISAVGHEIDFTIVDFVADVRAPTPSGAAELAVPDRGVWQRAIGSLGSRIARSGQRMLEDRGQTLDWLSRRLLQTSPQQTLLRQHDRLRELRRRLAAAARQSLLQQRPLLGNMWRRLSASAGSSVARSRHRLELAMRGLHAVSPLATLERGYAIVEDAKSGKVLMRASDTETGQEIRARLAKGELIATIRSKIHDAD